MKPVFFDTHAHLDFPDFADEIEAVVARAQEAGIERMITIGTDASSSRRAIQLSEQFPSVYAAVGWHPSHVLEAPDDFGMELKELASNKKVVALGETGLDFHRLPSGSPGGSEAQDAPYRERQARLFQQHLEAAAELGLNCVVHQRDALEETLELIEPFTGRLRAVFHCFVNDASAQRRIQSMGHLVSFTGIVTFKNAPAIRETLAATPLDQLMLETDSPYLAPVPYRGKRCEPAYVKEIAACVAEVKQVPLDTLSSATCATARQFFKGLG